LSTAIVSRQSLSLHVAVLTAHLRWVERPKNNTMSPLIKDYRTGKAKTNKKRLKQAKKISGSGFQRRIKKAERLRIASVWCYSLCKNH